MSKGNQFKWIAGMLAMVMWTAAAGAQTFNVKDFGATGNGTTLDTSAINNAIKAAHNAGGGVVTFPAGNYRSTSIHLTNNVMLYLSNNAVILAASSGFDSPESNPFSSYQDFGHSHFHNALIWGERLHDIGIAGPGRIDGDNNLSTADSPSSGQADKAISLKLCDRVTFEDFTILQGGHFGILANGCSNLTMNAAKILCSTDRDAFDLINSSHVLIINSRIEGSDDSMCLKADFALGQKFMNSDIHVINCAILSTGNNAVQFGSETIGDFSDVTFSGLTITAAGKAGLGVTSQDGSIIDGITFSDITLQHCSTPIFVKLDDQNRPSSDPHPLGRIRNLSFRNITATQSIQNSVEFTSVIHGKSGTPVENVTLDNVKLVVVGGHPASDAGINPPDNDDWRPRILGTCPSYGWYLRHVNNISFNNCRVEFDSNDNRPALIVADGDNAKLDGFVAERGSSSPYDLGFTNGSTFQVSNSSNTGGGSLRINASSSSSAVSITAPPTASPVGGTYAGSQSVALSSTTPGASIRFTTDGTTPTSASGTLYAGPVNVGSETLLKAVAFASGLNVSAVNAAGYSFDTTALEYEAESLARKTNGATASAQTDANASNGQWVLLNATGAGQWVEYALPNVPPGTYNLSMTYKGLGSRGQLNLTADGAAIGGVLDEYSPSAIYPEAVIGPVTFGVGGNHAVRLTVAGKNSASSGFGLSADKFLLTPANLSQVAAPVFNPGGGTFSGPVSVTITSATSSASIRYTTDGSTPSEAAGTLYSGPVTISRTTTLKAIAFKGGMSDSDITVATYNLPDFSVAATPSSRSVVAGSNTTYTVDVGSINGFVGPVDLGISGLPANATGNFSLTSVNAPGASTLTVTTASSTPAGTSTLAITGTSGSLSHSANVALTVTPPGGGGGAQMFEAENLAVANSGAGTSLQTDANASGGTWVQLNGTATNQWMEFTLPNIPAGTYTLKMRFKGNTNRGQVGFKVDGTPLGAVLDEYSASQTYPEQVVGIVTFSSTGNHVVRLTSVGRNAASTGFVLSADNFTLMPTTAFEAESLSVINSGVGTSLQGDVNASGGTWVQLNATGTNQWMEFTVPSLPAGAYQLVMMWKGNTSRGISAFFVDGVQVGGALDQYSATQIYPTTSVGAVTFSSTTAHTVRMLVVGRNGASSGFVSSADKFGFASP